MPPTMSLGEFIRSLHSEGRVRVPPPFSTDEPGDESRSALEAALRGIDADVRGEFPGEAPELSMPAAIWGADLFRRACGCLVHRDLGSDEVARLLGEPCPAAACPPVCYSVDLTFRYLPNLVRLARAASLDDPLVGRLMQWCREWPLSSVGVAEVGEIDALPIVAHPGLLAVYVDRIIEHKDTARARQPLVREEIRRVLGAYPELAPELATALNA